MKSPPNTPIIPTLEHATHTVALWLEHALSDLRLSQAEAHVLAFLAEHASCSINDLHQSFGHKRSTLTSLLDRLEQRGWVARTAHPTSRRMVRIELTDAGRPVAERVSAAIRGLEERLRARASERETEAFVKVIQVLEQVLEEELKEGVQ